MKKLLLSTTLLATVAASGAALADAHTGLFRTEAAADEVRASEFIGMRVYAAEAGATEAEYMGVQDDWNDVGEINDVILSRDGAVEAVLVDIGGFLGIGERQVAMSMTNVSFVSDGDTDDADDFFLVVPASRANFEDAPEYTGMMGDDAAMGTATEPMTEGDDTAMGTTTEPMTEGDDTAMGTMPMRDGYTPVERETLTAEALTGTEVYGSGDEWIGDVSELTLSEDGNINEVIVDVGGFLGIGVKPVALSFDEIEIMREADGEVMRVFVSMTEEEIEALPTYEN